MPKTQDSKAARSFKNLSDVEKGVIVGQHLSGISTISISAQQNVSQYTVNRVLKEYKATKPAKKTKSSTNKKKPIKRMLIQVKPQVSRPTKKASRPLAKSKKPIIAEPEEIVARSKKTDYKNTIGRHLDHINMRYSVVQGKPFIDPKYIARHLKLLKNLKNYELWCKSVVWADECRCHIYQRNGKNHICLESDVYYSVFPTLDPSQIIATVVVWGCIWPGGMGPLFTLKDNMTPEERSDFLLEKFLEFYETLPGVCRGGCPYIRDKAALPEDEPTNKKKGVGFEILEWPENGPAFTPLEYLWNYMSDNLLLMTASPNTPEELEKTLHEEWNNIDAGICKKFYGKTKRKLATIRADKTSRFR
ncbi:Homeodomain-like DNA binding domain-containing transcription factor [Phycomyces blakesleeanus]|uniref:Homeodomain-like DNA binding domain-containing transcription factor n=2 Tax=Phycomyces blakesleeanus TaxID=4837 RepID=A0A162VBR2_PHYB8|nr:Homeodomain-like DNA binding domain-containing transcription factor [Phycomyces blakesleeanus NRRL 1555(-)]OAD81472.1 Homeodomain-like DNA binding domain-containing transcription factor [Phycomyces blakesleeanus NRRL 1555(-)]|eukprot:XP_018299512.1 Homeodomain-like DNA binding domain-containing transcription factor [Phycomyces blakesleeanus NRRL 1555(-)]